MDIHARTPALKVRVQILPVKNIVSLEHRIYEAEYLTRNETDGLGYIKITLTRLRLNCVGVFSN